MIDYLSGLPDNYAAAHTLYHQHHGCCALPALAAEDNWADDMTDLLLNMVAGVYREKGLPTGLIDRSVTGAIARKLLQGIESGFGQQLADIGTSIDYDTPDANMLLQLQRNVWHFSAAKNYNQLVELSRALVGEDGKLRSWEQFKEAAWKVNDRHINQWLRVEYDNAVAGAQMAGKWTEIQREAATFPYLQFDVVMDMGTSEICRPLYNVVVPVGHPMLDRYYPPNHFGCRTTVRQLRSGTPTPPEQYSLPDIPPMFQTNVGKTGMAFPAGHPYFTGAPEEVYKYKP